MGARQKLNQVYFFGACGVAGLLGLATQSFIVFLLVVGLALIGLLHSGDIRTEPKPRTRFHRRRRGRQR